VQEMELGGWGLGGDLGRQSECHKVADVAELTLRVFFADTHTHTLSVKSTLRLFLIYHSVHNVRT